MKKFVITVISVFLMFFAALDVHAKYVKGYHRKDGTYVSGYYRRDSSSKYADSSTNNDKVLVPLIVGFGIIVVVLIAISSSNNGKSNGKRGRRRR